jgi:hypothetical protein
METNKQTQDDKIMADNILSCSSGDKEKMTAHAAWIDDVRRSVLILTCFFIAFVAITFFFAEKFRTKIAEIEMRHERALIKLQTEQKMLERQLSELKISRE